MGTVQAVRRYKPERTVHAYNNGGCPFISLQPWRDENSACLQHIQAALRDLRSRIEPGDILFLPSLRMPRLADQWGAFSDSTGAGLQRPLQNYISFYWKD